MSGMAAGRVLVSVEAEVRCAVVQEAPLQAAVYVDAPASRIGGAELFARLLLSTDLRAASHRQSRSSRVLYSQYWMVWRCLLLRPSLSTHPEESDRAAHGSDTHSSYPNLLPVLKAMANARFCWQIRRSLQNFPERFRSRQIQK